MSDAINQLVALRMAALLLAITIALPASAGQQPTIPAPNAQGPDPIPATPLARWDRPDAATGAELIRKRLGLIKQIVPSVSRVAVLWQPGEDDGRPITALQDVGRAAGALGLHLRFVAVADVTQLEAALSDISTGDVDAILVISSRMLLLEREYIVQAIAKIGLPAVYDAREYVEKGGLMSYGPNLTELEQYTYANRTTAQPNSAQIDQPIKLELVLNLKVARKLKITLTPEFLKIVDKTIE